MKYYADEKGKKVYTLRKNANNAETKDAHYKFIKIKSIKESKTGSSELAKDPLF